MNFPAEEDFHRLLDALTLCVLVHDAKSKAIVWANRAACSALGFSLEGLLPLKAADMTRPDTKYRREIAVAAMDRAETEGPQAYEWCYRSRTGVDMLSEAIATFVQLRERTVVMVQFRDISAEESMRQRLRGYETRLRELMHDLSEGVALLTLQGTFEYISESGLRVLGLEDLPSHGSMQDYCAPADRERLSLQLDRANSERTSEPQRYKIVRRDGEERWLRVTCRRVNIDGDPDSLVVHFRDISDEVAVEELRRAEARMLEHAGRYNAMGEMAMAIAHELSQPLAAVRNFIEGAIQRLNQSEGMDSVLWGLRSADRQAEHAALILKSVREYIVKREQATTPVDLRDILADVSYFIELRAAEAGVTVHISQSSEPLPVVCERVLIGQVILNLAFNAAEALVADSVAGGRVTIEAVRQEESAELRVIDNGRGVEAGRHERLFDGFSSSKAGGNGIGLSLCKNIISRHGGRIWAQEARSGGLDCRFSLPLQLGGTTAADL